MSEYQETREMIRKDLRNGGTYVLEIVQKRPYTSALIYVEGEERAIGVGFAKVNHEDPWVPDYGRRLAVEKAIACAAKEIIGEGSLLEVNGERVTTYTRWAKYWDSVPDWLLDEDLNVQPRDFTGEVPF